MGNTTNPERWEARQRLEFIEEAAFWRGWVQRSDVVKQFGVSLPQASADLQAYLELNPGSLSYDLKVKRYVATEKMRCRLSKGTFGSAIARFLARDAHDEGPDRSVSIDLPYRAAPAEVARDLFRAVCQGLAVEIFYLSVNSATETWRWILPHAFAHDGYRWHVRAYCYGDRTYKDFVIGRIAKAKPPTEREAPETEDVDWNTWDKIRLRPHRNLAAVQRRAVELDFEMRKSVVTLKVRRSMKNYTLAHLRLIEGEEFPRLLELAEE